VQRRHLRPLVLALALVACRSHGTVGEAPGNKPFPESSAQIVELRRGGVDWTDAEIRAFYVRRVAAIGPADEQRKREGLPVAERARLAYQTRRDARLLARAMMKSTTEVDALRQRDLQKYGSPDGPTFESLVAHEQQKGLAGDAVYEAIVSSAQRTDRAVNEAFGL
jgi:hypothetical protein